MNGKFNAIDPHASLAQVASSVADSQTNRFPPDSVEEPLSKILLS